MGRRHGLACGTILLLAAPAAATAQVRSCDLVQQADFRRLVNARSETIIYFQDPVRLECTGGIHLAADSAVFNQTSLAMELIGSVAYRDSTSNLTADWANYLGRLEQVLARGDVVLTDLGNGSVATGSELQYLRASPARATSHVILRGGRPHAVLRQARAAPSPPGEPPLVSPEPDTATPLDVTADRLEFIGDTLFLARGAVELERGGTTGEADSARFNQLEERLTLLGGAHVEDDRYRLEGERIDALVTGQQLRRVVAEERTSLISEDLTVRSERLNIGFVDGTLDRLQAWNPAPRATAGAPSPGGAAQGPPPGPPPERALALAEGFRLRADSIDAVADSGDLREVRAVGRAYGERRLDSLTVRLPSVIARDWIQGDTIIGYFTNVMAAGAEDPEFSEGPPPPRVVAGTRDDAATVDSSEIVLERVVVIGGSGPALSLYRMEPEGGAERGAINFMKAARIILFMTEGEVARVEAEGPIDGVYLDPLAAPPVPADGGGS